MAPLEPYWRWALARVIDIARLVKMWPDSLMLRIAVWAAVVFWVVLWALW
jgi:hypothetical protein